MIIGTVKEIKPQEYRVGLTPDSVKSFVARGHTVLCQSGGGENAGFHDEEYRNAGAVLVSAPNRIYHDAEMIVKVKEPHPYGLKMAVRGLEAARWASSAIHLGVNVYACRIVHPGAAHAFGAELTPLHAILE